MKFIAHRGLLFGPDKHKENHPDQIQQALNQGFECEIDIWIKDDLLYLGHDGPQYNVEFEYLEKSGLWIHAKNLESFRWLTNTDLNYFWHQEDDFVLTSKGYIWTYPGKKLTDKSIQVMPEWFDQELENVNFDCLGICSDFIIKIKEKYDSLV